MCVSVKQDSFSDSNQRSSHIFASNQLKNKIMSGKNGVATRKRPKNSNSPPIQKTTVKLVDQRNIRNHLKHKILLQPKQQIPELQN